MAAESAAGVVAGAMFTCDEEHFVGVNLATACAWRGRDRAANGEVNRKVFSVPKWVVTIL